MVKPAAKSHAVSSTPNKAGGGLYHLSNNQDDFLAQLERKAQADGLQFIEELVFENGAVYKG